MVARRLHDKGWRESASSVPISRLRSWNVTAISEPLAPFLERERLRLTGATAVRNSGNVERAEGREGYGG
jgi:hypothetical protein